MEELVGKEDTRACRKEHFEELLNVENERSLEDVREVEGPIEEIKTAEVKKVLQDMTKGKASGPPGRTAEYWKNLGIAGVEWLKSL